MDAWESWNAASALDDAIALEAAPHLRAAGFKATRRGRSWRRAGEGRVDFINIRAMPNGDRTSRVLTMLDLHLPALQEHFGLEVIEPLSKVRPSHGLPIAEWPCYEGPFSWRQRRHVNPLVDTATLGRELLEDAREAVRLADDLANPETAAQAVIERADHGFGSLKVPLLLALGHDDEARELWVEAASRPRCPFYPPGEPPPEELLRRLGLDATDLGGQETWCDPEAACERLRAEFGNRLRSCWLRGDVLQVRLQLPVPGDVERVVDTVGVGDEWVRVIPVTLDAYPADLDERLLAYITERELAVPELFTAISLGGHAITVDAVGLDPETEARIREIVPPELLEYLGPSRGTAPSHAMYLKRHFWKSRYGTEPPEGEPPRIA